MQYFDVSKLKSVKKLNSFCLLKFLKIRKFLKFLNIRKMKILELCLRPSVYCLLAIS